MAEDPLALLDQADALIARRKAELASSGDAAAVGRYAKYQDQVKKLRFDYVRGGAAERAASHGGPGFGLATPEEIARPGRGNPSDRLQAAIDETPGGWSFLNPLTLAPTRGSSFGEKPGALGSFLNPIGAAPRAILGGLEGMSRAAWDVAAEHLPEGSPLQMFSRSAGSGLAEMGAENQRAIARNFPTNAEHPVASGVGNVVGGVVPMLPWTGLEAVPGAQPIATAGLAGTFGATGFGHAYEEARDRGASPDAALIPAGVSGGLQAALAFTGPLGRRVARPLEAGLGAILPRAATPLGRGVARTAGAAAVGAGTLGGAQVGENVAFRETGIDPERSPLQDVGEQVRVGGLMSGLFHGAREAREIPRQIKSGKSLYVASVRAEAERVAEEARQKSAADEVARQQAEAQRLAQEARQQEVEARWQAAEANPTPPGLNPVDQAQQQLNEYLASGGRESVADPEHPGRLGPVVPGEYGMWNRTPLTPEQVAAEAAGRARPQGPVVLGGPLQRPAEPGVTPEEMFAQQDARQAEHDRLVQEILAGVPKTGAARFTKGQEARTQPEITSAREAIDEIGPKDLTKPEALGVPLVTAEQVGQEKYQAALENARQARHAALRQHAVAAVVERLGEHARNIRAELEGMEDWQLASIAKMEAPPEVKAAAQRLLEERKAAGKLAEKAKANIPAVTAREAELAKRGQPGAISAEQAAAAAEGRGGELAVPEIVERERAERLLAAKLREAEGRPDFRPATPPDVLARRAEPGPLAREQAMTPEQVEAERQAQAKALADAEKAKNGERLATSEKVDDLAEKLGETMATPGFTERLSAAADRARARQAKGRTRGKESGQAYLAEDMADWVIIGADHLVKTGAKFAAWSKSMVDELGDVVRPHLDRIYIKAGALVTARRIGPEAERQVLEGMAAPAEVHQVGQEPASEPAAPQPESAAPSPPPPRAAVPSESGVSRAEEVRGDTRSVRGGGPAGEGGQDTGGEDFQRHAEAGRGPGNEAGGMGQPKEPAGEAPEAVAPHRMFVSVEAKDAALRRIVERNKGRATGGLDPLDLADAAIVAAHHFEKGLRDFAAWSKKMKDEIGDAIVPHLQSLWDEARKNAWHGSPHDFDTPFSLKHVGTGEGAQAFGPGLYFAQARNVAGSYAKPRPGDTTGGTLYRARLNIEPGETLYLDWPLSDQSKRVRDALARMGIDAMQDTFTELEKYLATKGITVKDSGLPGPTSFILDRHMSEQDPSVLDALRGPLERVGVNPDGVFEPGSLEMDGDPFIGRKAMSIFPDMADTFVRDLASTHGQEKASAILRDAGIPAASYLDRASREAGKGTYNHVVFDESRIEKRAKYPSGKAPTPEEATRNTRLFFTEEMKDRALAEAKKMWREATDPNKLGMGPTLDPRIFLKLATAGAHYFEKGIRSRAAWTAEMLREAGPWVKEHLDDLWEHAQRLYEDAHGLTITGGEPAPRATAPPRPEPVVKELQRLGTPTAPPANPDRIPDYVKPERHLLTQAINVATHWLSRFGEPGAKLAQFADDANRHGDQAVNGFEREFAPAVKQAGGANKRNQRIVEELGGMPISRYNLDAEIKRWDGHAANDATPVMREDAARHVKFLKEAREQFRFNPREKIPAQMEPMRQVYRRWDDGFYGQLRKLDKSETAGKIEDHWAHLLKPDALNDIRSGGKIKEAATQRLAGKLWEQSLKNDETPLTADQALAEAKKIMGEASVSGFNTALRRKMGPFELHRSDIFGPADINWSVHGTSEYMRNAAHVVMQALHFADPERGITMKQGLDKALNALPASDNTKAFVAEVLRAITGAPTDLAASAKVGQRVGQVLTGYERVTKLTGVTSPLINFTQPLQMSFMLGPKETLLAYGRLVRGGPSLEAAKRAGVVPGGDVATAYREPVRGRTRIERTLEYAHRHPIQRLWGSGETVNNLVAAVAIDARSRLLLDSIRTNGASNSLLTKAGQLVGLRSLAPNEARVWFRKLKFTDAEINKIAKAGHLDIPNPDQPPLPNGYQPTYRDKLLNEVAKETQFRGDASRLPTWMLGPGFVKQSLRLFSVYPYNVARQGVRHAIEPLLRGNLQPLATLLGVGVGVAGEIAADLRAASRHQERESDYKSEWYWKLLAREFENAKALNLLSFFEHPTDYLDSAKLIGGPIVRTGQAIADSIYSAAQRVFYGDIAAPAAATAQNFGRELVAWREVMDQYRGLTQLDYDQARQTSGFYRKEVKPKDLGGKLAAEQADFFPTGFEPERDAIAQGIIHGKDPVTMHDKLLAAMTTYMKKHGATEQEAASAFRSMLMQKSPLAAVSKSAAMAGKEFRVSQADIQAYADWMRERQAVPNTPVGLNVRLNPWRKPDVDKILQAHESYVSYVNLLLHPYLTGAEPIDFEGAKQAPARSSGGPRVPSAPSPRKAYGR